MRLDIPQLRAFVTVARLGSFTRAAETLHLTQSAVSWQVRRLEERVGRSLLRRSAEGVGLTPDGRDILDDAARILAAHDRAVDNLRRSELDGRVRFGCADDLIAERLAGVLARFRRLHPRVRLEMVVDASPPLRARVEAGELDTAVVQQRAGDPGGRFLWREQPLWACGSDMTVDEVRPLPLVSFGAACAYRAAAAEALGRAGIAWYPVLECASVAGVRAAIAAGIGPGVLAARHLDARLAPVKPDVLPALAPHDFVLAGADRVVAAPVEALVDLVLGELAAAVPRAAAA